MQEITTDAPSRLFWIAFLSALISYMVMYGFELTHFTLSIDEDSFDNFHHTVELGRWGHAFLRNYILPEPFVPFFTMALSIVITSAATAVSAVYLFKERQHVIGYTIICASMPVLAYQFQFQNQSDTLSIALLISSVMPIVFDRRELGLWRFAAFVALGSFAMSIYQSIILLPVTLLLIKELKLSLTSDVTLRAGVRKISGLFLLVVATYCLYSLATNFVQNRFSIQASPYLSNMSSWGKDSFSNVTDGIWENLWSRLSSDSHFGLNVYWITIVPVCLMIVKSVFYRKAYPVLLALCIYIIPFALDIITGTFLPARTLTQLPFCFASLILLSLLNVRSVYVYAISFVLLCIGSANSNRLFYADYVSNKQDDQLSHMMISDLVSKYPKFNAKNDYIYFYGSDMLNNKWKPWKSENFGMSYFSFGDSRVIYYLNMTGFINLRRVDNSVINIMRNKIDSLPCWPQDGSIIKNENNYIIKYCSDIF